jgi:ABC-type transporter Mla MlaB component
MIDQMAAHPDADHVTIHLERLGRVDFSGALALMSVAEEAQEAGLTVRLVGVPPNARRVLSRLFGQSSPLLELDDPEIGSAQVQATETETPEAAPQTGESP